MSICQVDIHCLIGDAGFMLLSLKLKVEVYVRRDESLPYEETGGLLVDWVGS
jgi:hypothetical protein